VTDGSVIVVGGGPAGLASAIELRRGGIADVLVLDREQRAGGVPRHCAHQGFGVRDLHRVLSGPSYARRYVDLAKRAGVRLSTEAMVTGWAADGALEVTSPDGRELLRASAIVLATGCRERPRPARLIPGTRPEGVLTTGLLQQLVELGSPRIGARAVIVGAEHVGFSALLTLAHAGVEVVVMATDLPSHQSLPVARAGAALLYRVPLWTRTAVTGIRGRPRVEEVELLDLDTGRTRAVSCDTIVFTGDWIPDHELAVLAGLELDPGTRGPRVDTALRTTRAGIFAAGNLVQAAEPADVAALSGRHAAAFVRRWLTDGEPWPHHRVAIACREPLHWISPNTVTDIEAPPRERFALRSRAFLTRPQLEIYQDGRLLWSARARRLVPGRSTSLPSSWLSGADPQGGQIEVTAHNTY
jgi:thioredoxin reductase